MFTLRIEHPVTTFDAWKTAFDRFAPIRLDAGVRSHQISRPLDDAEYVVIDLDFDSADAAERFLAFLRTQVWASPPARSSPRRHAGRQDPRVGRAVNCARDRRPG